MKTKQEQIEEIMETLLAHEPIIDVPYETINDIAVALVREGYGNVKQAKIDILNHLKEKCKFDGHTVAVYKNDIDELIKEVQNEKNSKTNIPRFS